MAIAYGISGSLVTGALALRQANPAAFRTALLAKIQTKFPQVTLADLKIRPGDTGGTLFVVYHKQIDYWGIGTTLMAAATAAEAAHTAGG